MTQKLFLTSCIAMGVVAPAFAVPSHTDAFPDDGYMQEDYTYTNAATADNMDDVYEGTVNAVAEYDIVDYILSAGQYLPADSETPTTCPAGSYCSGIGSVQYNETSAQGIATCPTGYSLSAAGAKTADECYRTCTASDVEHSKSTGTFTGMFYSNNTNACEPVNDESCADGYHYKEAQVNPLANVDANIIGVGFAAIGNDGNQNYKMGGKTRYSYNISANGTWGTSFSYGDITGKALCSTTRGSWATTGTPDESGTGQYCWCQIDEYRPVGSSKQSLSGAWVYNGDNVNVDNCANICAKNCANEFRYDDVFRPALLGSLPASPAICEANTITINWSDASATDIATNNAGTATYGSDVRTPVKANTYKGKTFKGWRFSKPEQTQLP